MEYCDLIIIGIFVICMGEYLRRLFCILNKISETLDRIEAILQPVRIATTIEFYTTVDGQLKKVTDMFLKVNQNLPVSVQFKDKFGNVATVDGKPTWAVTADALATLEVAEDGMSAMVKPMGVVGEFKVQVTADADMGEGVTAIMGELNVELLPGEATMVEIAAGEPVNQE